LRHGIITPYTSFLAEENVNLADRMSLSERSRGIVRERLSQTEGRAGVAQRAYKGNLQRAEQAASGPAAAFDSAAPSMMSAMPTPEAKRELAKRLRASGGRAALAVNAEGELAVLDSVRNIGQKSFYRRNDRWEDSTVSADEAQKAKKIVQFSNEYFELAARHGGTLAKYLAFDEPVLLNLGGETYLITPETN
jgi:Ca-activated chloride channel family protein